MIITTKIFIGQPLVTAGQYFIKADSIANEFLHIPHLLEITTEINDINGRSDFWSFGFDSLQIIINSDTVILDTSFFWLTGMAEVTGHWLDSDSAMIIAENEGGNEFHENNENITISTMLYHASGCPYSEWEINYKSETNSNAGFRIIFNANDGSNIYKYYTAVKLESNPNSFKLYLNYPNPFNASTKISFDLPAISEVKLNIYNINGRTVYNQSGIYNQGYNNILWTPKDISTGIYFYEVIYNNQSYKNFLLFLK